MSEKFFWWEGELSKPRKDHRIKGEMDSKFKDPIVISLDLFKTCYPKLKFFGIAF